MNILIGVTGSIACYKTYDLVRMLSKQGHSVKLILSNAAERFLKAETFLYLGAKDVFQANDDFSLNHTINYGPVVHVTLAKWCDIYVIAPCSGNTLSKLAQGTAEDLMCSVFLALPAVKPVLIFPAMNLHMLDNSITQKNINQLKLCQNVTIFPTQKGEMVCGDEGEGKLLPIEDIADLIPLGSNLSRPISKHILITAGGTISPLDSVRYLTNASSGITGLHLAQYYLAKGEHVTLILGKHSTAGFMALNAHPRCLIEYVDTTDEMAQKVFKYFPECDVYISSAAISDIKFDVTDEKLKKDTMKRSLEWTPATDILKEVLKLKRPNQKIVGFAAETKLTETTLKTKWERKPVDLLVGNDVHHGLTPDNKEARGFGAKANHYYFLHEGLIKETVFLNKTELADKIESYLKLGKN